MDVLGKIQLVIRMGDYLQILATETEALPEFYKSFIEAQMVGSPYDGIDIIQSQPIIVPWQVEFFVPIEDLKIGYVFLKCQVVSLAFLCFKVLLYDVCCCLWNIVVLWSG